MMNLFIIVAIMTLLTGALGAMSKNSMRQDVFLFDCLPHWLFHSWYWVCLRK